MVEPTPDNLTALLARVRAGDEAALGELLVSYEPRLRSAARVLLGPLLRPHLDSVDLVQSVHRVLLPALREGRWALNEPAELAAVALAIVRRKVADHWRRCARQQALADDSPPPAASEDSPTAAAALETTETVKALLSRLEGGDRKLVELRLAGLETAEIARQMGTNSHAVRARLARLRHKLRQAGGDDWL